MIQKVYQKLMELARGGLFHIFGSTVVSQILGMVSAVLVIRFLPKTEYGYYTIANNLYSYIAMFIGMGMTSAILQFCSEKISEAKKNAVYLYALKQGTACNVLLMTAILMIAAYKSSIGDRESAHYLSMMCFLPFVSYINSFCQIVLRVHNDIATYARINMLNSLIIVVGNVLFTRFWNVEGLIISTYTANIIAAFMGGGNLKKKGFFVSMKFPETLERGYKKEIKKYATLCAVTNFTSTMLVLLDVTCLDIVLKNPAILADYKVASTIPAACMMIPTALTTYFYPQFVWNYSAKQEEFYGYIKRMLVMFTAVNGVAFIGLQLCAPLIVYIFCGEKYMNVVPIFRILSLNFFVFGSTRKLFGNVIAAMRKSEVNLAFSLVSGLVNIVMNLLLIPVYGSLGAAMATVCVSSIIGIASGVYLWVCLKR